MLKRTFVPFSLAVATRGLKVGKLLVNLVLDGAKDDATDLVCFFFLICRKTSQLTEQSDAG